MRVKVPPLVPQLGAVLGVVFVGRWLTQGLHSALVTLLFIVVAIVSIIPGIALFVYVSKRRSVASESRKPVWLLAYGPVALVAGAVPGAVIGLTYWQVYGAPQGLRDPDPMLYVLGHMTLAGLALSIGMVCGAYVMARPAKTKLGRGVRYLGLILVAMVMAGIFVGLIWRFI